MQKKYVYKFFTLDHAIKAGRLLLQRDPRGYVPPPGFIARAELIDYHPLTSKHLGQSQWWLFLIPNSINNIMAQVYLGQLSNEQALARLIKLKRELLAATILGCLHRGECRLLFCDLEGNPY